jgi:ABC-2 type transport system permease protein
MNKLGLIIKREFLTKVRNKSFIIMTILSPLLIVGLIMLVVFLNQQNSDELTTIAYVDESGLLLPVFKDSETTKYVNLTELGLPKAKAESDIHYQGLLYVPNTTNLDSLAENIAYFSQRSPNLSFLGGLESRMEKLIQEMKLKAQDIDLDKLRSADTQVRILTENFSGEKSSKLGGVLKMAIGGGFGYLIFMFIIIYGSGVMRSVIEEKTSRIIEVIISSVKPFQLMLGKILGNAFAGILQFVIWILSAGALLFVVMMIFAPEQMQELPAGADLSPEMVEQVQESAGGELQALFMEVKQLPWLTMFVSFIIYFFGGYLIYSSLYAAIGAAVDSETDSQQFMMPVMMPLIIAIYVGFSVVENPDGPIAVGFSIFPLTSPIVMLMRIPFGVPWWELLLSIVLLLLTFLGIVWFAAKIYRVGILMYGKKPSYKELYKWLRY